MDNTQNTPTVLSLCSGYGGIERGLDIAGVKHRVLAYVEIEAFAIANLVSKMEQGALDAAPIWTNVKTFPSEVFRGKVDLLTGGYPCQPVSAAGKRGGEDDPRHLWPSIKDIIREVKPRRVFLENVEGHISLGLIEVLADLEELGYEATWGVFSAIEAGASHQRKRIFIMANASSDVPDSESQRVQGLRPSRKQEPQTHVRQELSMCQSERREWLPEPDVGRVVDGCPDRVDRIRLLGNAVVPQTAAIAWETLYE